MLSPEKLREGSGQPRYPREAEGGVRSAHIPPKEAEDGVGPAQILQNRAGGEWGTPEHGLSHRESESGPAERAREVRIAAPPRSGRAALREHACSLQGLGERRSPETTARVPVQGRAVTTPPDPLCS